MHGSRGTSRARRTVVRILAITGMIAATLPLAPAANAAGNQAVQIDGVDTHGITLGSSGALGATQFTLELWFKRTGAGVLASTGTGGNTDSIPLITKGRSESDGSNIDTNYFFGIDASSGELEADFEDTAAGANHPVNGATNVSMNVWHHGAATFNGSQFCVYLDGVLDGTCTATTTVPRSDSIQTPAVGTSTNSTNVRLGAFAGAVDEVRIWNVAHTQAQIQATMNQELTSGTGLIGRYGLNEGSGTTTTGSVGPAGTLTTGTTWLAGAPALDPPPVGNNALQLNGTSQYVTFGTAPGLATPNFTLELWFQRTGAGVGTTTGTGGITSAIPLLTKGRGEAENSNVDMNYFLGIDATTGKLVADFEEGAGQPSPGLNHPATGNTVITSNVWHHAAVTYDGTTWQFYLDGVPDGSLAVGRLPRSDSIQHAAVGSALTSNGTAAGFFAGMVDEARIWNVARSGAQISAAKDTEVTSGSGLIGRWGMNEGAGTAVTGSVGSINGTTIATPSWVAGAPALNPPPPTQPALQFNGSSQSVTFGAAPGLGASTFTIETWFNRTGSGVGIDTGAGGILSAIPLLTKGRGEADNSNVDMNYFLGIDASTSKLIVDFEEGAGQTQPGLNHPLSGGTTVTSNAWHHAAATFDGTTMRIYLDGALDGTLNLGANHSPRFDSIQHAGLGTAMNSTGVAAGFFAGILDEPRVWNVARTLPQIQGTMNLELTSGTGLIGRWGLNQTSGTSVPGSVGGINGTTVGNPAWVQGAPFNVTFAPDAPALVGPTDGATGIGGSPTLDVTVSDQDGDPLDVTFFGREGSPNIGEDFTIMTIPDTQHYSDQYPTIYDAQTHWIVDSAANLNTAFVTHLGDIVEHFGTVAEWNRATQYQATLDSAGIKNNLAPGNHDFDGSAADLYDQYFPPSRYESFPWYGAYLGDPTDGIAESANRLNKDNYELFTAGGMDFLIIHLEFDMPAYAVNWAQNVINAFPNRHVILSTHAFINQSSQRPSSPVSRGDGMSAQAVWTSLVSPNCNIFMVVNGHYHGEGKRTDLNSCGQPVFQLNSDYQDLQNGGDGYLRYYTFQPSENRILARTFSPTRNSGAGEFQTDADSQFSLDWEMGGPGAYTELGTVSDVASGGHATLPWNGLDPDTQHDWYVSVSDGTHTTTGPVWSFTTENPAPIVDSVTIDPISPLTNDTLSANVTAHDPNGSPLTYEYQWIKNGTDMPGASLATLDLSLAGNGDKGDAMSVRVTAFDGSATSAPVTSSQVTVGNNAPTATVTLDSLAPTSNETIQATATRADADGDPLTLTYVWTVNGTPKRTTVTTALTDTFDLSVAGNGNFGDAVQVAVTPDDGATAGTPATATATVTSAVPPIFSDTFSTGDFSRWTTNTRLTIDATAGTPTAPSARAQVTAQSAFASKDLASPLSQLCMSTNVNLVTTGTAVDLFRLRTAANGAIAKVLVAANGILQIRSDFASTVRSSGVALGTGWHLVELCGTVGAATSWDLYRDGTLIVNDWVANTGTTPVGKIQIGDAVAKTFTVNFDRVILDRVPGENEPGDLTAPTTPGQPTGSSPSSGTITINWTASTDNTPPITYRVYRDGGPVSIGSTTNTSFTDIGLTPSSVHTYTVEAVDAVDNVSQMSAVSAGITVSNAIPPIFSDDFSSGNFTSWTTNTRLTIDAANGSPAAPSARAQTSNQSAFAYKDLAQTYTQVCMSTNVNLVTTGTAVDIFRLRTAANGAIVKALVAANGILQIRSDFASTVRNSGVALGTGWHSVELCGTVGSATTWDLYRDGVRIVNAWVADTGTTPIGRIQIGDAAAKTFTMNVDHVVVDQAPGENQVPDQTAPTTPGQPSGSSPSTGSITIGWAPSTDDSLPITYNIYRDGGPTSVGSTTDTTFTDIGLTPGSVHNYTVEAVDAADNVSQMSPASSGITVMSPTPPIFSDDFTSGNFTNWTLNTRLTIDAVSGSPAAPSARAQVTAQSAFAYKDLAQTYTQVCMSTNVNLAASGGTAIDIMRFRTAANGAVVKVLVAANGILQIRSDFASTVRNSGVALGTGWHSVELCGTVGSATTWDLYRDGVRIVNAWVADTGTTPIGRIQIGDAAVKTFTANFDHVVLDQTVG